MLRDCLNGDRVFGVVFCDNGQDERALPSGTVGCTAHIDEVGEPDSGQVHIVVSGRERFKLGTIDQQTAPYLVATGETLHDVEEPVAQLTALSLRLAELFAEAALAARAIADEPAPIAELASDPSLIAYSAAGAIDLDAPARQKLLESNSPSARMRDVIRVLDTSLPSLRERAAIHRHAGTNGRAPKSHA